MTTTKNPPHYGDYTEDELRAMPTAILVELIKNWQDDDNIITMTDSYKMTHHLLYPEKIQEVYSYMEPRGGEMPYTVFFGLQYMIKRYLAGVRVQPHKIEQAREMAKDHFGMDIFNSDMWDHIWAKHGGRLPLEIKAVPEGTPVAVKNVIMTIRNTDPKCAALTNIVETLLMKLWSSNTVAAYGRLVKELIVRYHAMTSDAPEWLIDFMHHDFGYRGCSSEETARLMGAAGLVNFVGTDTLGAISLLKKYYGAGMPGYSVIASEHSVMCAGGDRAHELETYRAIIRRVKAEVKDKKPASGLIILSLVSDTFNIYRVVSQILPALKEEFLGWTNDHGIPIKIVVRPDSGEALDVLFGAKTFSPKMIEQMQADMNIGREEAIELVTKGVFEILFNKFGTTENGKGYRVLHPQIGVLQGDGVSLKAIEKIYERMVAMKIDIMNLVFGSGGKYLQAHDRDEQKYAIKATHVIVDGNSIDIEKDPITDSGKKSKKGYLKLALAEASKNKEQWENYYTVQSGDAGFAGEQDRLFTVFLNGELVKEYNFDEVRKNSLVKAKKAELATA